MSQSGRRRTRTKENENKKWKAQDKQTKARGSNRSNSDKGEKARARKCGDVAIFIVRIGPRTCEARRQLERRLERGAVKSGGPRIEGRRASV